MHCREARPALLLAAGSLDSGAIPDFTLAQALTQARSARGQVMPQLRVSQRLARGSGKRERFQSNRQLRIHRRYSAPAPDLRPAFDWLTRGPRDAANASIAPRRLGPARSRFAVEVRRPRPGGCPAAPRAVVAQAATADTLAGMAEHRFEWGRSPARGRCGFLEAQRVRLNLSRARGRDDSGAEFSRTLGLMEGVVLRSLSPGLMTAG